jgi:hypothetical protein
MMISTYNDKHMSKLNSKDENVLTERFTLFLSKYSMLETC